MAATQNTSTTDASERTQPESGVGALPAKRTFLQTINPGYIVAGLSTLAASFLSIGKNFEKIFQENRLDRDLEVAKQAAFKKAYNYKVENYSRERIKGEFEKAVPGGAKEIEATYQRLKKERLAEVGIGGNFLKENYGKWKRLKPHHQIAVGLNFVTVAAIACGAIYSYSRESKLADKLQRQVAQNAEQNNQQTSR